MSSKCLHISHGIYKRGLYHLWMFLVLILHERVRLRPQKAKNLALKLLHGGMFGCKYRWAPLKLCLPSGGTYHMGYIKEVCIIHEVQGYWYSTNKSTYHPRKPKILLWNLLKEGMFGLWKGWGTFQLWLSSVHTSHGIYIRCLYHSKSALVLILHKWVRLLPN